MAGRALLSLSALAQIFGPFIADFSPSHVYNPRWPPHAKFHNGQTMSAGLILGSLSLYYTFRKVNPAAAMADSILTAALTGSVYWVSGLSAILYPGSKGLDPEFGEGFPQKWLFGGLLMGNWVGWYLEVRRLGRGMK
ncbi:hypothetical protein MMC25_003824 [Agyrium rufum]|nr:hypothetical protein [Agyrium rufum]